LGVKFTAIIPDTAPQAKVAAIERLGGRIRKVPREQYFEVYSTLTFPGQEGLFVHAFSDHDVMAGNATIGLEILEDLPKLKTIYIPYGGGGLSCGIASVVRSQSKDIEVVACEPDTAAPLAASFAAGEPTVPPFQPTFIDGAGGPHVFPEMFALAQELITRAVTVSVDETAAAVRFLAERAHVVAEGAGALALAAATKEAHQGPVVCIVSGGNINAAAMSEILAGHVPAA
jgi:threonine dehydratase